MTRSLAFCFVAAAVLATPPALHAGYAEGVEAFRGGDFERAVEEFRGVVDAQPEYAAGHLMLGRSLLERGEAEKAAASLERAAELEPEAPSHAYFLARARLAAGETGAALDALARHPLSEVPEPVRPAYAAALAEAAQYEGGHRGLELLEAAVAEAPDSLALQVALGRVHRAAERPGEAFTASHEAFELAETNPGLGRLAMRDAFAAAREEEDLEARREWYRRGVEIGERLVELESLAEHWTLLGEARMGAGDCESAIEALRRGKQDDALTRYSIGACALRLERLDEALSELRAALELFPDTVLARQIHSTLGAVHRHREDFQAAAEAYASAGDEEKVAEMTDLAEAAGINDAIDARIVECRLRRQELESLAHDHRELEGHSGPAELHAAWQELRAQCSDVMEIPEHPRGH